MLFTVFWPVCEVWKRDLSFNSFQSVFIMWVCWGNGNLSLFHSLWGRGHWGIPNTVIPLEKLASTENYTVLKWTKNWYRIYDRSCLLKFHSSCVFVYLKHVCTCNQPQPLGEDIRRPLIDQCNYRKAWSKIFFLIPNIVSQKDKKSRTTELDDTAIPHIQIQVTEMSLKKKAQYQYLKPPCRSLCCCFFLWEGGLGLKWKNHLQLLTLILTFFIFVVVNR